MIVSGQENQGAQSYSITIIWFALLSSLTFSFAEFLKKDFDDGTIEQLLLACENFEVAVFAKMLAGWLIYCFPIIISSCIFLRFADMTTQFLCEFFLSLTLASLAISFICSFCGSLSILAGSAAMIATIALPLIIPVVLIAHKVPHSVASQLSSAIPNIGLLSAIALLSCCLSVLATTKIVKIAAE